MSGQKNKLGKSLPKLIFPFGVENQTALIITVLNEEKTIETFLDSVFKQKIKPAEVIVVDGGSTDQTRRILKTYRSKIKVSLTKNANRSMGRNLGAKRTRSPYLAFSDAGGTLDPDWLAQILKPFKDPAIDVVAGYYRGVGKSVFEKCVIPFVLVPPDKVNRHLFLPASRSMALKAETFWQNGGFPAEFSDNEDYVFARRLLKNKAKIAFAPKAIYNWFPRQNLKSFWTMIFRFARGDARAGLRWLKVFGIYSRYFLFLLLFALGLIFPEIRLWGIVIFGLYLFWSIFKNYRYVDEPKAIFWLPVLQITADFAVMAGSLKSFLGDEKN